MNVCRKVHSKEILIVPRRLYGANVTGEGVADKNVCSSLK